MTIITFGINWKIVFIYNGIKDVRHKENYCLNYCDFIMDSCDIIYLLPQSMCFNYGLNYGFVLYKFLLEQLVLLTRSVKNFCSGSTGFQFSPAGLTRMQKILSGLRVLVSGFLLFMARVCSRSTPGLLRVD